MILYTYFDDLRAMRRMPIPKSDTLNRKIEVWHCEKCGRYSRITEHCVWCSEEKPEIPEMRVISESDYAKQFVVPPVQEE
jgi:hypothetical protein